MLNGFDFRSQIHSDSNNETERTDLCHGFTESQLEGLYCCLFTPSSGYDATCLYVHGGPGSHCEDFEFGITQIPELAMSRVRWITYDQRHCGRSKVISGVSPKEMSHSQNVSDLAFLLKTLTQRLRIDVDIVYGHSYGARVAFDTFEMNEFITSKLLLGGRSVNRLDGLNNSLIMDLLILRRLYPERYQKAYEIVTAQRTGSPRASHIEVRNLFPDKDERQRERASYYWGNLSAMKWYQSNEKDFTQKENDELFCTVAASILSLHDGGCPLLDPKKIHQPFQLILGFFDFIMGGAGEPELGPEHVTRFNGSGHYPHFEEPMRFVHAVLQLSANSGGIDCD